jgi:hypothetical protein
MLCRRCGSFCIRQVWTAARVAGGVRWSQENSSCPKQVYSCKTLNTGFVLICLPPARMPANFVPCTVTTLKKPWTTQKMMAPGWYVYSNLMLFCVKQFYIMLIFLHSFFHPLKVSGWISTTTTLPDLPIVELSGWLYVPTSSWCSGTMPFYSARPKVLSSLRLVRLESKQSTVRAHTIF